MISQVVGFDVRKNRRTLMVLAVLALVWITALAALAQTPEPPPTLDEMTTSVTSIVNGIAIVLVMVAAGFVFGAAARFIGRLVRSGR